MARSLRLSATPGVLVQLLLLALALAVMFVLPATDSAQAAAADILIADLDAGGPPQNGPGRVIRLSHTGAETGTVYSGPPSPDNFVEPSGIALASNGDIVVADAEAYAGFNGGVIRLNPTTGQKVAAYQGSPFVEPTGVAVTSAGDILVVDQDAFGGGCDDPEMKTGCGGIIRIDAAGNKTRFDTTLPTPFWNPTGIAIAANGDILVADLDAPGQPNMGGPGTVFRLNSAGAKIAEYSIAGFEEPSGVAVDSSGDIYVADAGFGPGRIFRLNSAGQKIREYSGGQLDEPTGVAIAYNGDILVADQDAGGPFEQGPGGVVRVNRETATQTTHFSGTFQNPAAIALEPGTPPSPTPGPTPTASSCQGLQVTLSGTAEKDTLKGSQEKDVISSLAGNDVIKGFGGDDRICAGTGKDKVSGGAGKDRLYGEAGNDKLLGGKGNDRLVGGKGKDTCIGGPGKDKYVGCEIKVDSP